MSDVTIEVPLAGGQADGLELVDLNDLAERLLARMVSQNSEAEIV